MVCQMLEEKNVTMVGNLFDAFVYAADNGASIAQCSWSYGDWNQYYNQSQITAMDYFIENAGIDVDGNQVGPMAGGLIVFAAANGKEDLPVPFDCYPARYERVIAATAFGPDLKWANYANYGDWVDIAAPGGNFYLTPGLYQSTAAVLSTDVGNSYSWQNGTSMAAPHVSGVAALILSICFILQATGFLDRIDSVEDLQALIDSRGSFWAPIIFIVLQMLQVFLLPLPGVLTVGAGVLLFGAWETCLYSYIGIVLGSLIAFAVGNRHGLFH